MATLIRNRRKNSVVLPMPGRPPLTFMPNGDPASGDLATIDDAEVSTAAIQDAIRQGLIEIVPEEEHDAAYAQADGVVDRMTEDLVGDAMGTIERKQDRDLIGTLCIGPGPRPGLTCGATILRASADVKKGDAPPLCGKHESLSAEYYQTEVQVARAESGVDDGPVTQKVWKRVEMAPPRRSLA